MAALTSSAPFQNALKPCPRRNAVPHRRTLLCRAEAGEAEWSRKLGVHLLAAGIALSVSLGQPNIAEAGVVMEQPKSRKLFQGQKKAPAPKPVEAASSGGGLSLPSVSLPSVGLPSISLPSLPTPDLSGLNITPGGGGGIDPRVIALPGAILGIAGAGFAAYTLDGGFRSMMKEGLVKDSSEYAGYEEAIDDYAAQAAGAASKGTKRISKAAKKTTQKGKQKAKQAADNGGGLFGFLKK